MPPAPPPVSPSVLPLDSQLCFSLYAASMAIGRVYKPLLDRLGITYPQYLVLSTLWEEDGRSVGAIAGRLSLEPSTITPLVTRLELAKLVRRKRDTRDERRVEVRLTAKGRDLREKCGCLAQALLERSGMPLDGLLQLNEQVSSLRDALAASGTDARA